MDKIREEFEKWDSETFGEDNYEKDEVGDYQDNIVQQCWQAWQAAWNAALSHKETKRIGALKGLYIVPDDIDKGFEDEIKEFDK